ncbi:MAG: Tol-Pal system beta propeller repeat protein TolB, partial [Pseudohongiellaceae bacterium]
MFQRITVGIMLVFLPFLSHAQLTIEITQGVDRPTRIAVVPFRWGSGGSAPENFDSIISEDLRRSGLFDAMAASNMLSFPYPGSSISFRDWRVTDTEYVLTGRARTTADGLEAEIELHNVLSQNLVMRKTVYGGHDNGRDVAHRIADLVYETITGIPGIFGTKIIYVTDATMMDGSTRYRLMLADQDGAREQIITESSQPLMSPTWSPDGNHVAYVSFETGRPAIFTQELGTGQREQLTNFRGINGAPAWSPDGSKMAMSLSKDGNPEIYVMDIASRTFERVTNHFAIDTEPNWTPDGENLVFTSDRGGRPQIYQINLNNKRLRRLTFEGDYNARPRLSLDGRYLVMVHRSDGQYHIAVQDLELDRLIIVTETSLDESPTMAPNSAMVMYATKWQGRGILSAVSLDAGIKYRLPA